MLKMSLQREMTKLMIQRRGLGTNFEDFETYFKIPNKVLAYFVQHTKVTNDTVKHILSILNGINLVIIVYAKSLTPEAKNVTKSSKTILFQTFTFAEMSFDLIKVVPRHSLYKEPALHEWWKFPSILSSDIVARYYGFSRNDIIRIEDDGEISYRKCV